MAPPALQGRFLVASRPRLACGKYTQVLITSTRVQGAMAIRWYAPDRIFPSRLPFLPQFEILRWVVGRRSVAISAAILELVARSELPELPFLPQMEFRMVRCCHSCRFCCFRLGEVGMGGRAM